MVEKKFHPFWRGAAMALVTVSFMTGALLFGVPSTPPANASNELTASHVTWWYSVSGGNKVGDVARVYGEVRVRGLPKNFCAELTTFDRSVERVERLFTTFGVDPSLASEVADNFKYDCYVGSRVVLTSSFSTPSVRYADVQNFERLALIIAAHFHVSATVH